MNSRDSFYSRNKKCAGGSIDLLHQLGIWKIYIPQIPYFLRLEHVVSVLRAAFAVCNYTSTAKLSPVQKQTQPTQIFVILKTAPPIPASKI